jgi:stearoyl-CoA desaturase (delta-9 desaturase)
MRGNRFLELLTTQQVDGPDPAEKGFRWIHLTPYLFLHLACLGVIWVGWSPVAVGVAIGFYLLRAFFITGFYHRYFSHRSFRTSRPVQFLLAVLGNTAVQRGPLWWASHHRRHHGTSDREGDPHSPHTDSFLWSHIGWLTAREHSATDLSRVKDLARFPELRWLDRFDTLVPALTAAGMFALGAFLERVRPDLGTSGWQMLVWGFFISTVILFHVTCLVNSATHTFGKRPFETRDQSRNSLIIALLTLGEGWHNNHHHYPASTRAGFAPWEIDVTYYVLKVMSLLGLIRDMRPVPVHVLERRRNV